MRLIGSEATGFHVLTPISPTRDQVTQLLECESCGEHTDDVAWNDALGIGQCEKCWGTV